MKSISAVRSSGVHADGDADELAIVEFVVVVTILQRGDDPTHGFLGIVLDVAHVGVDDLQPELADHLLDFTCTPVSLAATWAARSAMFSSMLRQG